jgi:hypothetical protein
MRTLPCILIVLTAIFPAACRTSPQPTVGPTTAVSSSPPRPARINHLAFFKLKSAADAEELISDCDRLLRPIPGVVSYFTGKRLETGRSNLDTSFDVGFYVGFATEADYERYVKHPNHLEALAKWKPRWESVRIVDVLDETE